MNPSHQIKILIANFQLSVGQ